MRIQDIREDKIITEANISGISVNGKITFIMLQSGYTIWINSIELAKIKKTVCKEVK